MDSRDLLYGRSLNKYNPCTKTHSRILCLYLEVILEEEVEMDEVYLVAGFQGQPLKVAQKKRKGRRRRLKGKPGRGTLD